MSGITLGNFKKIKLTDLLIKTLKENNYE